MDGMTGGGGGSDALALMEAMGTIPLEQARLMRRRKLGEALLSTPGAQGRQVGQTYVAASPLEHLANAMSRGLGAYQVQGVDRDMQGLEQLAGKASAAQMAMQRADKDRDFRIRQGGLDRQLAADAAERENRAAMLGHQGSVLTETIRHNQAMEGRPPSFPVLVGAGGEQFRIDPRNPRAPAIPVVSEAGTPVVKPQPPAHASMADVVEAKRKMLSDAQVKTVAQYDTGLDSLRDIMARKAAIDTGPFAARRNAIAGKLGIDDPDISAFRASVGDSLATYIRSLSGAAVSDRERAFLVANVPKMEDNDAVFNAKLKTVADRLQRLRAIEVDLFGKQGKDIGAFGVESAAPAPAAAPKRIRVDAEGNIIP